MWYLNTKNPQTKIHKNTQTVQHKSSIAHFYTVLPKNWLGLKKTLGPVFIKLLEHIVATSLQLITQYMCQHLAQMHT